MKQKAWKSLTAFFVLVILLAGSFLCVKASGTNDEHTHNKEESNPVGGGYAITGQIPGVYYMPKLYDATNGMPTSEANCILAASDGYIWIGGYSGIIKYDGVRFERLPVTDGLNSGRGLFEDKARRIWVATNDSGIVVLDGQERYHFTKEDGLPSNSVRTFAEDNAGNVFVGTTAGICYVDTSMTVRPIRDDRINNERVLKLESDASGNIYGQTASGCVFLVSTSGIRELYTSSELGMDKITTILADPEEPGKLYFGTSGKWVYHGLFGDQASEMKRINVNFAENVHWLHYACNRLWVSSTHVAGYVNDKDLFVPLESLPMKDAFEMMTSDYQGNMWYASSKYGVMKIVADNFLDITGAAQIDPEPVNATCLRGGDLYVGTDNGICIIDTYYAEKSNFVSDYFRGSRVRCIMNDSKGNTWFSEFSGKHGLVCLNKSGNLTDYKVEDGMPGNEIRCTYEMQDGTLAVGTNSGVAVLKDMKVSRTYTTADGLKNTVILTVCEGNDGEIYAGTDGDGIYVIKGDSVQRIGMEEGLGSDVIMRIKKDDALNLIWVITSSTVEYIKDGEIHPVTSFPYNNNFDVFHAGKNTLWFLCSQGIYAINEQDVLNDSIEVYKLYDTSNGLTSIPISHCYSNLADNGILYVAGGSGVSAVNAGAFYDFSRRSLVGLRSVTCDGEEIFPKHGTYALPKNSRRIQIMPAILDYTVSDPLVRVYLDDDREGGITVEQSKLTPLEYTNLKYGSHKLHIQVLDDSGTSVLTDKSFILNKKAGFFELTSVRLILMLLALAAIGIAVWRILTGTVIRKQYQEIRDARFEAEKANSAKSMFLANMSHELLTPINTIMGKDEMILRENAKDVPVEYLEPVTNYAKDIRRASESLMNQINDLIDISRIESGKMQLIETEYEPEKILGIIISEIRPKAEEKKLFFKLSIDETLPKKLYGDGGKIKQILLNILSNAVKYTDEGGFTLSVKVTERSDVGVTLRFSVKDTGIGIKEDILDKLFFAHEKMDEGANEYIRGVGLGMDISRQFAELMGGKLWCESVYGEGSEFILTCKQKVSDGVAIGEFNEARLDSSKSSHQPKFIAPDADVLVVDDNPVNLENMKGLLKPNKLFVSTAASGEEALEKISRSDFNLVFLDYVMPGMDGPETLKRIRETHPNLPVYALVGSSVVGGEELFRSKGFNGYLNKPVDITVAEDIIMKHLPDNIMMRIELEEKR